MADLTVKELTIEVPIKPYLKKYISYFYETEPFRMSRHGLIPQHMWLLFAQDYTEYEGKHDKFVDKLQVCVPHLFLRQGRIHFDLPTIRRLNKVIEDLLWQDANTSIEVMMEVMPIKDAISTFQAKYNIGEGELSYETIKKRFYRYRQQVNSNGLSNNLSTC